jgi:CheY-like chemotaxis protein
MDNNIYLIIGIALFVLLAIIVFFRKEKNKTQQSLDVDKKSVHAGVNTEDLFRGSSGSNDGKNGANADIKSKSELGKNNPAMNWVGVDNYNDDLKEHTLKNKSEAYSYNAQDILQKAKDRLEDIKQQKNKLIFEQTQKKVSLEQANLGSMLKTSLDNQHGSLGVQVDTSSKGSPILDKSNVNTSTGQVEVIKPNKIEVGTDGSLNLKPNKHSSTILNPLILVVDDAFVVRKKVGDLLQKNHYDISSKNDGWEAFAYLSDESNILPNLIITDIEMPNMDGFQLIESIRKNNRLKHLPIIVISSHVEDHLAELNNDAVQGFISKPFVDEDLLSQISFILTN